jgi:hypothetical protein
VDPNEGRGLSDPFPNLKDAFALGQEALKLFFIEDSPEEKFEVSFITSPFRDTTQLKFGPLHTTYKQDIYNVRPLPYIIGTKSYVESADAGLGGIGIFEDEHQPEGAVPATGTAGSAFLPDRDEASDSGSFQGRGSHPAPANTYKAPSHYDYDDGEDDVDAGGQHARDDSTIQSADSGATPPPPRAPKPTGNPLKDMLNAQIMNRGSISGPPPAGSKPTAAAAWGDDSDDEESTAGRPQQKSVADVVGRAAVVTAAKGRHSDDASVQSDAPGAKASAAGSGRGAQAEEEEDDDEGDLFSANDDPFGLFGSSKRSASSRVHCDLDLFGSPSTSCVACC